MSEITDAYIQEAHDAIYQCEDKIARLREETSRIKTLTRERIAIIISKSDFDEALEIASEMYWLHDDLIDVTTILQAMEMDKSDFLKCCTQYPIELECIDCHKQVDYFPRSRSDAKFHMQSATCVCLECQERRKHGVQEWQRRFEEKIKTLREMPYAEYLQTEHWQTFRRKALKRSGFRCQTCNAKGELHVHHRTYENRGNEDYTDVIVLCRSCHQTFHENRELQS